MDQAALNLGFSHAYHLPLSWLPGDLGSFGERLDTGFNWLQAAGAEWFRPHIPWNSVEPLVTDLSLRPADVNEERIGCYLEGGAGIHWAESDLLVGKMAEHGIRPHLVLGAGYDSQLPLVERNRQVRRFTPAHIPLPTYLARLALHARAVVRRYKGVCHDWQVENEINGAGIHAYLGWREGFGWFSHGLQQAIVETLVQAVKEEDPAARVSHNFMIPLNPIPYFYTYLDQLRRWYPLLDIVGVDPYPNFFNGQPIQVAKTFRPLVEQVREVVGNRPVYLLETGYPVRPEARGFSEVNQAEYFRQCLEFAEEQRIPGLFFYCFCSQEGRPGHEWCRSKSDVQDWWGLVRADGSLRPAYADLVKRHQQQC
jgi:hypothetical protein